MITNGQDANDVNFNAAFVSKTDDTIKEGKLTLADADEGFTIDSVQQYVNDLGDVVGTTEGDATAKQYATNHVLTNGQNRKQALEALDLEFSATGHTHSGVDGEGQKISGMNLSNFNLFESKRQVVVLAGSTGGTINDVVTSLFVGKTPGGNATTLGVVTTPPHNFCHIRGADGLPFISGTGAIVFGRLIESAGNWTIDYYYLDSVGNEVGHTFVAYAGNISIYYNEVFNVETKPTFEDESVISGGGGGGGGGASEIEVIVTAGENLLKGDVVVLGNTGIVTKHVLGSGFVGAKQLGIMKDDVLNTQSGLMLYGGVYDAGSNVFVQGVDYFCSTTSTLTTKDNIPAGNPIYKMGTALDTQKLAINFEIQESHDFPVNKEYNLFTKGQASDYLIYDLVLSRYKDAAGVLPVDGTGGTATVVESFSRLVNTSFYGTHAFRLSKTAANGQGEGWSFDFPVPLVARTKVHTIQFDYVVQSGTFNAEDLHVYFYDVTNSQLIQPSGFKLLSTSTTLPAKVSAEFQMPANCSQGRLILHVASTNASAWAILADNIKIVPNKVNLGAAMTDWIAYTPTFNSGFTVGTGGGASNLWFWRRNGDRLEGKGGFYLGSSGASMGTGAFTFTLPAGLQADRTKDTYADGYTDVGRARLGDNIGSARGDASVAYSSTTTTNTFFVPTNNGSFGVVNSTTPFTWGAADFASFEFSVPIQGWSSNLVLSQDTSTRTVAAKFQGVPTGSIGPAFNTVTYPTRVFDLTGSYTGGTFTAPVPGVYNVSAAIEINGTESLDQFSTIVAFVNGVATAYLDSKRVVAGVSNQVLTGSNLVQLKAGDAVTIRVYTNISSPSYTGNEIIPFFNIYRLSGPEQIAASETIAARYFSTASTVINTTPTNYLPATRDYDTHNSYNTSTGYAIPVVGLYEIKTQFITATYSTASTIVLRIQKNAVNQAVSTTIVPSGVSGNYCVETSCRIRCLQGDIIKNERVMTAGSTTEDGLASSNFFEIIKVGN